MISDSQLAAVLDSQRRAAESYQNTEARPQRRASRKYYEGDSFGNELKDRSQVISRDVRDRVEALMPSLMKIFASGDQVVRFEPTGPEDRELARQATDYVNHIFMKENEGYKLLYEGFKDALIEGLGVYKVFVDDKGEEEQSETRVILNDELEELQADENFEVEVLEEKQVTIEGIEVTEYKVKVTQTVDDVEIRVWCIDPNDFLVEDSIEYLQNKNYMAHRIVKVKADLIEWGLDPKQVMDLPSVVTKEFDIEEDRRSVRDNTAVFHHVPPDPTMERVRVIDHYVRMDMEDGQGTRKWRVLTAHKGQVLDKEEWDDDWPFAEMIPTTRPHEFYGISIGEEVLDIQLIKSTLWRTWLDNMYGMTNNMKLVREVTPGDVDIDAVLNPRVDSIVRVRGIGSGVEPIPPQPIGDMVLPAMEYCDRVADVRTGTTKFGEGLEPDALQRTPVAGVTAMMSAAQDKQLLIVRNFAETGIKNMFRILYSLARKYRANERTFRLRGGFMSTHPGKWPEKYDLTVNVGLGTGHPMEQVINAEKLFGLTEKSFQAGYSDELHLYEATDQLVKSWGYNNTDAYVYDPRTPQGMMAIQQRQEQMAQQQQPDNTAIMAQLQAQMAEVERRREADQQNMMFKMAELTENVKLKKDDQINDVQLEREKLLADVRVDMKKLFDQFLLKMTQIQSNEQLAATELGMESALTVREQDLQAAQANADRAQQGLIDVDTRLRSPLD